MAIYSASIRIDWIISKSMLNDAKKICFHAIDSCLPEGGVARALEDLQIDKEVYLLAVGKAAFNMALEASRHVSIKEGIVISKYGHISGSIKNVECFEAGHPIPDRNGLKASEEAIRMCEDLKSDDIVLFLLSGGASALFESPLIPLERLQDLSTQMLKKGLNIFEINAVRKKLSRVKGGRFGDLCKPAKVYSIILSDVLSDRLDTIGSGPTVRDETGTQETLKILEDHDIDLCENIRKIILSSAPGKADNCENIVIGSVRILCQKAMKEAERLGYKAVLIDDHIDMEARDAGQFLFEKIQEYRGSGEDVALIMGGETIVHVKGKGLGGRNQELVFSQMKNIAGMDDVLIMSVGSDGTDGPTDAAGGYVDGSSYEKLKKAGGDFEALLEDNDSYHGLKMIGSLIFTGPTGTNVNDISIALIKRS